jgi:hypothetical protein
MSNISLFGFYCDLIYLQMIFLKNIEWLIWTELNWSSRTWPNLALAKPGLTLSISPRSLSLKRTARTRFPSPYASSDVVATLWFRSPAVSVAAAHLRGFSALSSFFSIKSSSTRRPCRPHPCPKLTLAVYSSSHRRPIPASPSVGVTPP